MEMFLLMSNRSMIGKNYAKFKCGFDLLFDLCAILTILRAM